MGLVYEQTASGDEVREVIEKRLMPVLTGVKLEVAVGAMCSVMLSQMYEGLTEQQLLEGIKGITGWMVTYLSSLDEASTQPALVN